MNDSFDDSVFGTFTWNGFVEEWETEVVWEGTPIAFTLAESAEVSNALEAAYELWRDRVEWNQKVRDFVVQELLKLKNEFWLSHDEPEFTPQEFLSRITLHTITVWDDGSFEFYHNDGKLFCGHMILISGNLAHGLTNADIPG